MDELPASMHRNGRPADPHFAPEEQLFMRIPPGSTDEYGALATAFRFPEQSVNREKYSGSPEWVLLPRSRHGMCGILAFAVKDVRLCLPPRDEDADGMRFDFRVEHTPMEDNYPHSDVRAYREDDPDTLARKVRSQVKQRFRMLLSERSRIVRRPVVA